MFSMRKTIAAVGAGSILFAVAACGNSTSSNSNEISFQTWNLKNDTYTPYFNDLIAAFQKENPGVTVKWIDQPADGYTDKIRPFAVWCG